MINFEIINNSGIDNTEIEKIIKFSKLSEPKRLLFVVGEESDDNQNLGEFVPRECLLREADGCSLRKKKYKNKEWDAAIVIYKKTTDLYAKYPCLFVLILGHELGHAKAYLKNPDSHYLGSLIQEDIRDASNDKYTSASELPHEVKSDEYGKYVAVHVCGNDNVDLQLLNFLIVCPGDTMQLKKFLSVKPSCEMGTLFRDLLVFAKPYRSQLEKIWKEKSPANPGTVYDRVDRYLEALKNA